MNELNHVFDTLMTQLVGDKSDRTLWTPFLQNFLQTLKLQLEITPIVFNNLTFVDRLGELLFMITPYTYGNPQKAITATLIEVLFMYLTKIDNIHGLRDRLNQLLPLLLYLNTPKSLLYTQFTNDYINQIESSYNSTVFIETMFPLLAKDMQSTDSTKVLEATVYIRKLLSRESNPLIKEISHAGFVPKLVELMNNDTNVNVQFESAWALGNIASGDSEYTKLVVECGAIHVACKLLTSSYPDLVEQAAELIGNCAGDSTSLRDYVLKFENGQLYRGLCNILELADQSQVAVIRSVSWTVSNCCRGKPPPDIEVGKVALPGAIRCITMSSDPKTIANGLWILSYLTDCDGFMARWLWSVPNFDCKLLSFLNDDKDDMLTPALRTIGNVFTMSQDNCQPLVRFELFASLQSLLRHKKKSVVQEAVWLISNIAADQEFIPRIFESGITPDIIKFVLEPNVEISLAKEATWVLANLTLGCDEAQIRYLVSINIIEALCKVINNFAHLKSEDSKIHTKFVIDSALAIVRDKGDEEDCNVEYIAMVERLIDKRVLTEIIVNNQMSLDTKMAVRQLLQLMVVTKQKHNDPETDLLNQFIYKLSL